MNQFEKNILGVYREKGQHWLDNLIKEVEKFKVLWKLSSLQPVEHLSFNYVLSGFQNDKPIILKLGPDALGLTREADALLAFKNHGAVSIVDKQENALLLEKMIPGHSLKTYALKKGQMAIEIACQVITKLRQAPPTNTKHFSHIEDILKVLDEDHYSKLLSSHVRRARSLKHSLLQQSNESYILLHGDLHQNNILLHREDEWKVIDPKGTIGLPINELWACIEDPIIDINYISNHFNYKEDEVRKWYYIHLICVSCWHVKENLNPKVFLNLAEFILPML